MLDKIIHFLIGSVFCLGAYVIIRMYSNDYRIYMSLPVLGTFMLGVGIELFSMLTNIGVADAADVAATMMGSWCILLIPHESER